MVTEYETFYDVGRDSEIAKAFEIFFNLEDLPVKEEAGRKYSLNPASENTESKELKDFEFLSVALVKDPPNPHAKIIKVYTKEEEKE